jgi:hypothetical protein
MIGRDETGSIDDEARAERGLLPRQRVLLRALAVTVEEILEELLEGRARRELRDVGLGAIATTTTAAAIARAARRIRVIAVVLTRLDRLRARNIDHRRQQLGGEIGEAVGRGLRAADRRHGEEDEQGKGARRQAAA